MRRLLESLYYIGSVAIVCVACDGADADGHTMVRDSASIRIVESTTSAWGSDGWHVSSTPHLSIGRASDEEPLFQVLPPFRLNQRIYAGQRSTQQVLVFDEAGNLLGRFGGRGGGPGEFNSLAAVYPYRGDSILAYDFPLRLTVFDSDGNVGRTTMMAQLPDGQLAPLRGVLANGDLVASTAARHGEQVGLTRNPLTLWHFNHEGAPIREVVTVPGTEMYYSTLSDGRLDFRPPFFGQTSYVSLATSSLVIGMTDSYELQRRTLDGEVVEIIRRLGPVRSIASADVERLIERRASAVADPNVAREVRQFYRDMPAGSHVPAFGWPSWGESFGAAVLQDDLGFLWVAEYPSLGEESHRRSIFSPTGEWLGVLTFPRRFAPSHIGADFILGVWKDADDVEHIRLYGLVRSPTEG